MADQNDVYAVFIHGIPSSIPVENLARIPPEDQPDGEILLRRHKGKLRSTWSIAIALTRPGTIKRASEFVKENGGKACLRTFASCRKSKSGNVVFIERQPLREASDNSYDSYDPWAVEGYRKAKPVPLSLAVKTFLTEDDNDDVNRQKKPWEPAWFEVACGAVGRTIEQIPLPLYQAEKRANRAARMVEEQQARAKELIAHKQMLDEDLERRFTESRIPPLSPEADKELRRWIDIAAEDAYLAILRIDQARKAAQLQEEIALSLTTLDHNDHCDTIVHYALLYQLDETEDFAISPSEVPDPKSASIVVEGSRRWKIPRCIPEDYGHPFIIETADEELCDKEIYREDCDITFEEDDHYGECLQISFRHYWEYALAEKLRMEFEDHQLELVSSTSPIAKHMTVIGIDAALSGSDLDDAQSISQIFNDALGPYVELEYAWRVDHYTRNARSGNNPFRQSFDQLLAVATFKEKPGCGGELYKASDLPGWVSTKEDKILRLDVMGRPTSCSTCSDHPVKGAYKFHTSEQCTRSNTNGTENGS